MTNINGLWIEVFEGAPTPGKEPVYRGSLRNYVRIAEDALIGRDVLTMLEAFSQQAQISIQGFVIRSIPKNLLTVAMDVNNVNEAANIIQTALGIKTGDVAGQALDSERWEDKDNRVDMICEWLVAEVADAAPSVEETEYVGPDRNEVERF